jgi:hypothetical protein
MKESERGERALLWDVPFAADGRLFKVAITEELPTIWKQKLTPIRTQDAHERYASIIWQCSMFGAHRIWIKGYFEILQSNAQACKRKYILTSIQATFTVYPVL